MGEMCIKGLVGIPRRRWEDDIQIFFMCYRTMLSVSWTASNGSGSCDHNNELLDSIRMLGISWMAEQLLAGQERLCFLELDSVNISGSSLVQTKFQTSSEPTLRKTCDSLVCDNRIESSAWTLWKFTRKFSHCEIPSFTNVLVNTLNKREHLLAHLWTFYTIVLQFLHSLHFGRKPLRIIHDGFPQHSCFWHKESR
jgi:hypothetical protein